MDIEEVLQKHKLWLEDDPKGEKADLSGTDLSGTNLPGVNLSRADLLYTDLQGTDLLSTNLTGANLAGANLLVANLTGANLTGANLVWANLTRAKLQNTSLQNTDLRYADLTGVNLDFSCLPLWCGSFDMIVDDRFVKQLLCHFARLDVSKCSGWIRYVHRTISNLYNCKNWFCRERDDVKPI